MKRNHRWHRGDLQIIKWLFSDSINFLSKYKILDNLRRPLVYVVSLIAILVSLFTKTLFLETVLIVFVVLNFGYILGILDSLIFGRMKQTKELLYIPIINGIDAVLLTMVFNFLTLPYRSYIILDAFIRSIYRMVVSKKKLLEWTTADEIDKSVKNNLWYYYINMLPNVIMFVVILFNLNFESVFEVFIAVSFVLTPVLAYLLR
ncbi:MAG: hypothetical protein RSE41_03960 [Clostridia bacterium]